MSCKDAISQEYLMECVIQVFPDEYHLATLHEFLHACSELDEGVQVDLIFFSFIFLTSFWYAFVLSIQVVIPVNSLISYFHQVKLQCDLFADKKCFHSFN